MQINCDEQPTNKTFLDHLKKRWFFTGNFILITTGVLSVFGILNDMNIQMILYMIPCVTFSFMGIIKSFYFMYHEDIVHDIIRTLKTLQNCDDSTEKEIVEVTFANKHLPFLKAANFLLLSMCYSAIATFCVGPLVVISWLYWSTGEIKLFLPYMIWYPFDESTYAGWLVAYLHQLWSGMYQKDTRKMFTLLSHLPREQGIMIMISTVLVCVL